MRRWITTLVGIVFMAASVYGYSRYVDRLDKEVVMAHTLMPSRLIASGELVEESMLRSVAVPAAMVQPNALTDPSEIIGKTAVVPIGPEEQILPWKLAASQLAPGIGERYISFKTDDVSNVSNLIRKGDRVDVWVEFAQAKEIGGKWVGSLKIIEGLMVASVRSAEGVEITDALSFNAPFQDTERQRERVRSSANAKPDANIFIMSEQIYEAYSLARLAGTIKLMLPDLSMQDHTPARVASGYEELCSLLAGQEEGGPP